MAICQAEVIHEINAVLRFALILASGRVGSFWVLVITSTLAALVDLVFVLVQRHNRPRLLRLMKRQRDKLPSPPHS